MIYKKIFKKLYKVHVLINLISLIILNKNVSCNSFAKYDEQLKLTTNILFKNTSISSLVQIDDHICTREENYTEILYTPIQQPVRVRTLSWCMEIPPRCSSYRTEIREVVKEENITKTRTIRFCCEGFSGILSGNETVCRPVCRGGCGRGHCEAPEVCKCDPGFIGQHCTQRCPHNRWGDECLQACKCQNNALCDNKNGACKCTTGWIGEMCHIPCPTGYYGAMCKTRCQCNLNRCNPQTGECIYEEGEIPTVFLNKTIPKSNNDMIILKRITSNLTELNENLDNLSKSLEKSEEIKSVTRSNQNTNLLIIDSAIVDHNPSTTGNIENDKNTSEHSDPEVIHVIDWQHLSENINGNSTEPKPKLPSDVNAMLISLIVLIVAIVTAGIASFIFYRKYWKPENGKQIDLTSSNMDSSRQVLKSSLTKPLPDLPAFIQTLKIKPETVVPEFYDSPTNNSAVTPNNQYSYVTTYSTVSKSFQHKDVIESHLYDEIRYPGVRSCRV